MDKHFNPSISIEKFAAFLDGNLPQNEMQNISSNIEHDEGLKAILDTSNMIDTTLENIPDDVQIPDEIANLEFDLPNLTDNSVDFNMFHIDDTPDVSTCADDSFYSDTNDVSLDINDSIDTTSDDINPDNSSDLDSSPLIFDDLL
ncbi:hypothetical protein [uncultured Bacteroides sp.]|mgnify:CR=1 FL=1|uniref:hypothetical protein n=1 Tax=uncultured Bacteroides sp. TaxID=162156 RepID=UPI0025ED17E7|nr:hypothetical protein [uncultured Bacteroides sp.]